MKNIFLALVFGVFASNTYALDIKGDAYDFAGNITSITLTDEGGVINVVGETGEYGKVWLTYNLNLDRLNYNHDMDSLYKTIIIETIWKQGLFSF